MKRVYLKKNKDDPTPIESLLNEHFLHLRKSITLDAVSTSVGEAVCGRKYRRSTWVSFAINCFNQYTGIGAILLYANRLLVQMNEQGDGSFPLTPIQGTYIIGFANALASSIPVLYA